MKSLPRSGKFLRNSILLSCLFCAPHAAVSNEASRIEEILHRKNYDQSGQVLVSEVQARVRGCEIHLILDKPLACEQGASFYAATDVIDLRAIVTDPDGIRLVDFTGTRFELMKGAAEYPYRSLYNRLLRRANDTEQRIEDEEFKNHPTDVETRLKVLDQRYRNEIDPRTYSMSSESIKYCSGIQVKSPLKSEYFTFYLEPEDMNDFVGLIDGLAKTCIRDLNN